MYSLVLMTALAGGGDTASWGRGCGGCHCYGCGCYSSCYGGGCSCWGGCHGGWRCGGCHCYGGCWSSCYGGCWSSCYGAGCSSCWGGCCSAVYYPTHYTYSGCCGGSCYGGGYGGCYGGGYGGCYGGAYMTPGVVMPPAGTSPAPMGNPGTTPMTPNKSSSAARISVELPANATLTVDGNVVKGEGTLRHFHTPVLAPGQSYFYEMTAEVVVDGKPEVQKQKVVIVAGDMVTAKFDVLLAKTSPATTAVAAK